MKRHNICIHAEEETGICIRPYLSDIHCAHVETSHFSIVDTYSCENRCILGCEVVGFTNEDICVELLPSRAIPGYHVEFYVRFRDARINRNIHIDNNTALSQHCLRHLRVSAYLVNELDSTQRELRPVISAGSDSCPVARVYFAPLWHASNVDSSFITISSITLASQPVSSPPLPAVVQVGVNHALSEGRRGLDAAEAGNAVDVYAALCDGCSTGERDEVRLR